MFVCSIYPKPINRFLNRFSLLKTGIVSYNVRLENGHLTSWHRRYLTRDIPEKVVEEAESLIHDRERSVLWVAFNRYDQSGFYY